jgi:hypothetical protein
MAEEKEKVNVPAAPSYLPEAVAKQWSKTYETAYLQAKADNSEGSEIDFTQTALREANRLLRVPVLKSYADAMKAEEWHFIKREVGKDGKLHVVTADGKKHKFDVPAGKKGDDSKSATPAA